MKGSLATTRRPRLPLGRRVSDPPPMVLMERDKAIVLDVHEYGLLSTPQIEKLHFQPDKGQAHMTKTSRCRHRLKLLFQHRFLDRIFIPVGPHEGSRPIVYCLDKRGADLVAQELGIDRAQVHWRPKRSRVSSLFLEHTLRVNNVRIAVELAARKQGLELLQWMGEGQLKAMKERVPDPRKAGRSLPVVPDGYFTLKVGERKACFFLEVDRATMTNRRFGDKMRAYEIYVHTGRYFERYQTRSLRVLVVTTTHQRLANLKSTTEEATTLPIFWFTTIDQVQPETILTSEIWKAVGKQEPHKLLV